jgi:hypothetical protein
VRTENAGHLTEDEQMAIRSHEARDGAVFRKYDASSNMREELNEFGVHVDDRLKMYGGHDQIDD